MTLPAAGAEPHLVGSLADFLRNTAIGPVPGLVVVPVVALFYLWVLFTALRRPKSGGELAYGDVHV
jgi:uncharacterized membrane protein